MSDSKQLRHARYYGKLGLPVLPCVVNGKKPVTAHGCLDATTDAAQIEEWWSTYPYNVGIATGNGIVVLDVDVDHNAGRYGDETLEDLEAVNGPLPDTWTCLTGGGGVHYYFSCTDPDLTVSVEFAPSLDYRGAGGYVIAPGSVHESGREYLWEVEHTPTNCPLAPLPDWLHKLMLAARKPTTLSESKDATPDTWSEGQRNDGLFRLACSLRARGLTVDEIAAAVQTANRNRCNPPLDEREVETICKSTGRYERGEPSKADQDWEPPVPFNTVTLPDFPTESLPGPLTAFVECLAESTQTPEEMAGLLSLGVLATAFQSRLEVEITPDWREPLSLYTVAVAPPGERKSAVISALTKPIYEYEAERRQAEAVEIEQNRTERALLEKALQAAQTRATKGKMDYETCRQEALALSAQLAEFQDLHPYRLLVDDTTPEKLVDMMDAQGGCITVASAEGGVFDALTGRYDNKGGLDVYLKGHAGDPIIVDRIGRSTNSIPNPRLSLLLTVQPEVLEGLMSNTTFRGRGLCGRFLFAMCKSKVGHREVSPPPMPDNVRADYRAFVRHILSRQWTGIIHLSPEADKIRCEYQSYVEEKLGDQWESMRDWGSKLVGAMVRIAALMHAAEVQGNPIAAPISAETMAGAASIAEFLSAHAMAAYQMMGADRGEDGAKYLWQKIERTGLMEISKRDLFRLVRGRFKKAESMEAPLRVLVEYGYVRIEDVDREGAGRKASPRIKANPLALGQIGQNGLNM